MMKSVQSKAFPTSKEVYFFKIRAIMSVPPEDASALNRIAAPIAVSRIA